MSKSTNMHHVLLHAALELSAKSIAVFPCRSTGEGSKAPLTRNGFRDASTVPDRILHWWKQNPQAAIGVPTGEVSGVVVLDIDVRSGKDGRKTLSELNISIPATSVVHTPSGGLHYYFANPEEGMRCSAGVLGLGIDTRGDGGYVIVPPSRIEEGEYQWKNGVSAFDGKLPFPPAALFTKLQSNKHDQAKPVPYGFPIPMGQRNDYLTHLAGKLLRERITLRAELVSDLLHAMNLYRCRPPLPDREVDSILNSLARKILRDRAW